MSATYEQKKVLLDYFRSTILSPLPHLHKELELIYIRNGACRAIVNDRTYELKSGDLFLTFPYQVHYYLDSINGEYYVHAFPASILVTMADKVNAITNNLILFMPVRFYSLD